MVTNNPEIEAKEQYCIIVNMKSIIQLLQVFYINIQILIYLTTLENQL